MLKKLGFAVAGIALIASPAIVSAQTTVSLAGLSIASLQQLVQQLEQELQQLIAAQGSPTGGGGAPCMAVGGGPCGTQFTASPTYGAAPLSVTFTASGNQASSGETVTFGDGASGTLVANPLPAYTCVYGSTCPNETQTYSVSHTYTSANTYTATLLLHYPQNQACTYNNPNCNILGTATVTVTGSCTSNCGNPVSFTANPASGAAPLAVNFNASGSGIGTGDTINFGDQTSGSLTLLAVPCADDGAVCPSEGFASHTYQNAGTYTATLYGPIPYCPVGLGVACQGPATLGTATVAVTGNSQNGSVTISSISPASGYSAGLALLANQQQATQVTITGTGLSSSQNEVVFTGPATGVAHAFSTNGTQLTFGVPSVQGCLTCELEMLPQALPAGAYQVDVQNSNGTSNSVPFTVLPSSTQQNVSFTAWPASGQAPLPVAFSASGGGVASGETVSFGDGTFGTLTQDSIPEYVCATSSVYPNCANPNSVWSVQHTYQSAGTYTATLFKQYPQTVACPANDPTCNTLGTAAITVTSNSQNGSFSVSPTSGEAPLTVTFTGVGSNISFGDGTGQAIACTPGSSCAIGTTSHTYQSAGMYVASSGGRSTSITVSANPIPHIDPLGSMTYNLNVANALTGLQFALQTLLGSLK